MEPIYIPQLLKSPKKTQTLVIEEFIPNLDTLTPVRGSLAVTHRGTYLEISAEAETIVTLVCDRCLQTYNHRLSLSNSELIWLDENALELDTNLPLEREINMDDLSEKLPPNGHFYPETWLYEQLCLSLPMRQLCGKDCQSPKEILSEAKGFTDGRWASLESLKQQLNLEEEIQN